MFDLAKHAEHVWSCPNTVHLDQNSDNVKGAVKDSDISHAKRDYPWPLAYALDPLRETHDWFASLHCLQGFSSGFSGSGFHVSHGILARSSALKVSARSGQKAFQG